MLFDVKLPEDDVKEIETRRNVIGLYVEVYNQQMYISWYFLLKHFTHV